MATPEIHNHFVIYSDMETKIGEVSDSIPHFEREIFKIIGDHAMDLEGLARGDDTERVAWYRFTNHLGRPIEVRVRAIEADREMLEEVTQEYRPSE